MNRDEAMARRLAAHGLLERRPPGAEREAAAACGLPDSPAGSARDALAARVQGPPALDGLVGVWGPRGATYVVPRDDVAVFTLAAFPPDEAAAARTTSSAPRWLAQQGWGVLDAIHATADAMRDAVQDGPLDRQGLHDALRERLPDALLWPCRGCGTRHAHPSLWRAAGLRGEVVHAEPPEGGPAVWGAFDGRLGDAEAARRELVTRLLRCHGPLTAVELGQWLGTGTPHAEALLALVDVVAVDRAGTKALDLAHPPPPGDRAEGVRLLAAADPLTDTRDRATLVPDAAARRALWPALGRPGAVLVDGEVRGAWRARRARAHLAVRVERFAPFDLDRLGPELEALGAARGLPARLAPPPA